MSRYSDLDFANGSQQSILSGAIEKDKQWGLWHSFLSILKEQVLNQIKSQDFQLRDIQGPDMYKNLVITVIEDENKLEGVDIKATTYNFIEWMRTAGLDEILQKGEMQDINIENLEGEEFLMKFPAIPRYQFYIHADKEMIESFSTDLKTIGPIDEDFPIGGGWSSGKNFLYLVSPSTILSDIEWRKRDREDIRREDNDKEEDIDMEGNLSKKVRGGTLLDLYVKLLNGFDYFYNHDEEGFWIIA